MALPHYHTMPTLTDPVYQNLFEVILISPTFIIFEELFDHKVEFINNETDNLINLNFTINEKFLKNEDIYNIFKDIHYIHLTIHNKKGEILKKELLVVKFKSSQFTFRYSDSKLLDISLVVYNKGIDECDVDPYMIQKRLIRDSKINEVFNDRGFI
jgi:hypothetical protein